MHEMPGVREDGELVLSYFGGVQYGNELFGCK